MNSIVNNLGNRVPIQDRKAASTHWNKAVDRYVIQFDSILIFAVHGENKFRVKSENFDFIFS